MLRVFRPGLLWGLPVFLTATMAIAQGPTGTISGMVTDASGAVIPNATLTILNRSTNISRTATTNAEGF